METDKNLLELHQEIFSHLYDIYQYKLIFNNDPGQMKLLKSTAETFFSLYRHYFWRRICNNISVITDPPKSGKNKNITISIYEEKARELELSEYKIIFQNNILIREFAKPFRKVRNKIINHLDENIALEEKELETNSIELLRVEKIYDIIRINSGYFIPIYNDLISLEIKDTGGNLPYGDAKALIKYLRKGYDATLKITDPEPSSG